MANLCPTPLRNPDLTVSCGPSLKQKKSFASSPPALSYHDIPGDRLRDVIYYNPVVKQKRNDDGTIKYRVHGTAGGNLLDVPYDVSARTASLDVVKLLLHSTVSDKK